MPCLIAPQRKITTNELIALLTDAMQVLSAAVTAHSFRVGQYDRYWACRWKRQKVRVEERTSVTPGEHDFVEILNQSANVARLIDVLEWVRDTHAATDVRVCDPTQSNEGPVDLVVENKEKLFLFEVTDTAGAGLAAKIRRQVLKLDTAMNAFRVSPGGKPVEAFHVFGANTARPPESIEIGHGTFICPHRPVHII